MSRYEQVARVERVRIAYRRGTRIAEGQESRVYRVGTRRYPSGTKYVYLVWSDELRQCVWIREDDVIVLSMSIQQIHSV